MKILVVLLLVFFTACNAGYDEQQQQQHGRHGPRGYDEQQQKQQHGRHGPRGYDEQQQKQQHGRLGPRGYYGDDRQKTNCPPKYQVDMVQDAFWDYVGKKTMTSKEYVWQVRQSPPGKSLCDLISKSIETIYGFFNMMYTQVVLWTNDFYHRLCHEIDHLKYHMEEFLEDLEDDIEYRSKEMAAQLRCKMEDLKKYIAYYVESLDPQGLKECIMQKTKELQEEMYECYEYMQNPQRNYPGRYRNWHKHYEPKPDCDKKKKIDEHMEEFQGVIVVMVNNFESQLVDTTNEINSKMVPRGKRYSVRMGKNEEEMKDQLKDMWNTWSANKY